MHVSKKLEIIDRAASASYSDISGDAELSVIFGLDHEQLLKEIKTCWEEVAFRIDQSREGLRFYLFETPLPNLSDTAKGVLLRILNDGKYGSYQLPKDVDPEDSQLLAAIKEINQQSRLALAHINLHESFNIVIRRTNVISISDPQLIQIRSKLLQKLKENLERIEVVRQKADSSPDKTKYNNPGSDLQKYLQAIRKYPNLSPEEERDLACRLRNYSDESAANKLITSHLAFVVKMAMKYQHYGLPLDDLISEGTIGLTKAVKHFDPARCRGRLINYAAKWIKHAMMDYVLTNWSLVQITAIPSHQKLFFNLYRMKNSLLEYGYGDLQPKHAQKISDTLEVPLSEVMQMNQRLSTGSDTSLNAPITFDGSAEKQDFLKDQTDGPEDQLIKKDQKELMRAVMAELFPQPPVFGPYTRAERSAIILRERRFKDDPATLFDLGQRFNISLELVRMIEKKAVERLQKRMNSRRLKNDKAYRPHAIRNTIRENELVPA